MRAVGPEWPPQLGGGDSGRSPLTRAESNNCRRLCATAARTTARTHSRLSGSILFKSPQHVVELIEAAITDSQHPAFAAVIDRDCKAKRVRNPPLARNRIGVLHRAIVSRAASA